MNARERAEKLINVPCTNKERWERLDQPLSMVDAIEKQIKEAVDQEREECAKEAENCEPDSMDWHDHDTCKLIAQAIRERK